MYLKKYIKLKNSFNVSIKCYKIYNSLPAAQYKRNGKISQALTMYIHNHVKYIVHQHSSLTCQKSLSSTDNYTLLSR